MTRKQGVRLVLIVLCLFYCVSYAYFRHHHQIVHHAATAGARYTQHTVEAGDAWAIGYSINSGITLFYTPLRYLELGFWLLYRPIGSLDAQPPPAA